MALQRHIEPALHPVSGDPGLSGEVTTAATLVAIVPDAATAGYVVSDAAGQRVFGDRVFSTAAEAEAYVLEVNRRSPSARWKVKRLRRHRDQVGGHQLPLF